MKRMTPKDLENPKRRSGYNFVKSAGGVSATRSRSTHDRPKNGKPWHGAINSGGVYLWRGPRRATELEAAQDVCDYINSQRGATPATLASHGHKRTKPKRKIEYTQEERAAQKVLREGAARRKVEVANYVYLVGMEGNPAYVKIGEAFDPEDRYIGGQTFNPYTLVLLGYFKTDIPRDADKAVHQELASSHHKGEWFRPTDAVLSKFGVSRSKFLRRCGGKTKEVKATA